MSHFDFPLVDISQIPPIGIGLSSTGGLPPIIVGGLPVISGTPPIVGAVPFLSKVVGIADDEMYETILGKPIIRKKIKFHRPVIPVEEFNIDREDVKEMNPFEWQQFMDEIKPANVSYSNLLQMNGQFGCNASYIPESHINLAKYKIHLMCKSRYLPFVIKRILRHKHYFPHHFNFKFLPYSVDKKYIVPFYPQHSNELDGTYFMYDGKPYPYETVDLPMVVFYVLNGDEEDFITTLLQLFPDDKVEEYDVIDQDRFPRLNIRISAMIYIALGNADDKLYDLSSNCSVTDIQVGAASAAVGDEKILTCQRSQMYDMPKEVKERQATCKDKLTKDLCQGANIYSQRLTGKDICEWKHSSCIPARHITNHILLPSSGPGNSIKQIYKDIGKEDEYETVISQLGKKKSKKYKKRRTRRTVRKQQK